MIERVFLGMGSNLGDRRDNLRVAIASLPGKVVQISNVYRTDPVGGPEQDDYFNLVVEIATSLNPLELLEKCLLIEQTLGRERVVVNGPRTIDIDLLLFGDRTIESDTLVVPHPRMDQRNFVLVPLQELYSEYGDGHDAEGVVECLGPIDSALVAG